MTINRKRILTGSVIVATAAIGLVAFAYSYSAAVPDIVPVEVTMATTSKPGFPPVHYETTHTLASDGRMVHVTEKVGRDGVVWSTRDIYDPTVGRFVAVDDATRMYHVRNYSLSRTNVAGAQLDPSKDCLYTRSGENTGRKVIGRGTVSGYSTVRVELGVPKGYLHVDMAPDLGCAIIKTENEVSVQEAVSISRQIDDRRLMVPTFYSPGSPDEMEVARARFAGITESEIVRQRANRKTPPDTTQSLALPASFHPQPPCADCANKQSPR